MCVHLFHVVQRTHKTGVKPPPSKNSSQFVFASICLALRSGSQAWAHDVSMAVSCTPWHVGRISVSLGMMGALCIITRPFLSYVFITFYIRIFFEETCVNSKRFWVWCIMLEIIGFLGFVHRRGILDNTMFRQLDLFPSSREEENTYSIGSLRMIH
jgi:hypothetical protein